MPEGRPRAAPSRPVLPGDGSSLRGAAHDDAGFDPEDAAAEVPGDPGSGATPLVVARRERDEYLDALRRLQADFENYKKRMLKQQTEHLERAAGGWSRMLPVLDTADLAIAHGGGEEVKQLCRPAALEREAWSASIRWRALPPEPARRGGARAGRRGAGGRRGTTRRLSLQGPRPSAAMVKVRG